MKYFAKRWPTYTKKCRLLPRPSQYKRLGPCNDHRVALGSRVLGFRFAESLHASGLNGQSPYLKGRFQSNFESGRPTTRRPPTRRPTHRATRGNGDASAHAKCEGVCNSAQPATTASKKGRLYIFLHFLLVRFSREPFGANCRRPHGCSPSGTIFELTGSGVAPSETEI